MKRATAFRFIIIGAGSAGCVLADRLSQDPRNSVLLLEAGRRDINPLIHMPAGISRLVHNKRINWHYYTEPQPELRGRRLYWPRGKVLGGSSSINAMCYVRGQAQDYDDWSRTAGPGWRFEAVLPYFRRAECQTSSRLIGSAYHGRSGRLAVGDLRDVNPLSRVFVDAAVAAGVDRNDDFNGSKQRGAGLYQVTQFEGRRCSAAVAYLNPARGRPNLTIATHSRAIRIAIEHGRAVAVDVLERGRPVRYECEGETILCGGAINSPQLLLASGVGPPEHLRAVGLSVLAPLPGVGRNLQDHLDVCVLQKCTQAITYDFTVLAEMRAALVYAAMRRGPGVSNVAEAGAFLSSRYARDDRPDIQMHFIPAQLDDHGRRRLPGHGYTVHACNLRPESRGHIELRSNDPLAPPRIHANYLQEPRDLRVTVAAVHLAREVLAAKPFDAYRGMEVHPGSAVTTDDAIEDFVRERAETIYHPVGTCRMGNDREAVVDPQLRVHGVEALRIVDASIMPTLISGNTNAPTIMIAEKAADLILSRGYSTVADDCATGTASSRHIPSTCT